MGVFASQSGRGRVLSSGTCVPGQLFYLCSVLVFQPSAVDTV